MDQALIKKASALGVEIAVAQCRTCAGAGVLYRPDPLDLRRLREKHKVSKYQFLKVLRKPSDGKKLSGAFLTMVEDPDPEKGRACPEWLFRAYLEIPTRDWTSQPSPLPEWTDEERAKHLAKARAMRGAQQEAERSAVQRGQVWERVDPERPRRVVDVVSVTNHQSALVRPHREAQATPRVIKVRTLLREYRNVTAPAAAGAAS